MTSELIQKKVFFGISDDVIRLLKKKVNIYIPIGNRNQMIKFENVQYRGQEDISKLISVTSQIFP